MEHNTLAMDNRAKVAPKYFVVQKIAGKRITTRFSDRTAALIYYAAVPAVGVECNYGKGPAKIR